MARKKKTALTAADIVTLPLREWTPGDAQLAVREDMVRLQEAVIEKLAFIDGLKMVNARPVTLSIPDESARKFRIPSVLTPTLLPLPLLVKVAKALEVDLSGVRKGAWSYLYKIEI
jgi:hypothetical protein